MIHSMSGGIITQYDVLLYAFVQIESGADTGVKRWFISHFIALKAGDRVRVPVGRGVESGLVLRVERVTAQTAPFPVKHTSEIIEIID